MAGGKPKSYSDAGENSLHSGMLKRKLWHAQALSVGLHGRPTRLSRKQL